MKRLIVFSIIGLSFLNCINPAGILESSQVDIIITEIMYNRGTDTLEFIEFKNRSLGRVNIGGYYFSSGIEFQFPDNIILDKDVYFILTNSEELFTKLYP
ncbi:MAG TPA: lamin tail domain-containing protein, partial [Chitinispirillaceae bacterium]|nr:lamin tail domain-containing protein [Chitinispirillaceae bacterium]